MPTLRTLTPYVTGRRALASLAYVLVLLSCGESLSPGGGAVAGVVATPATLSLSVGGTATVSARVLDDAGAPIADSRVFWSSEDPLVATVSQGGVVSGVAPGDTRIAASSRGMSAVVPVSITSLPVSLVRVTPTTSKLRVGATLALLAEAQNAAGDVVTGRPVSWSSSAPSIATVSASGSVTAIAAGVATVTATIDGASGSALLTIEAVPVASVRVSPDSGTLLVGQALQLSAIAADSAGAILTGRPVSWSSSAPAIAAVSSTGMVNTLAAGSVTITALVEGKSGTARLNASRVPVDAVIVSPATATLTTGRTLQLTARTIDSTGRDLTGRPVTWSSDRSDIASVALDGVVTAVAAGRARISATAEGKVAHASIDVTPVPVASLSVTPTTLALTVGSTQQLVPTPRDAQGAVLSGRVVTWISGAPTVASVSPTGVVSAIGAGTALIIATCEGQQATVTLTTTLAPVATLTLSPPTAGLNPDSTLVLVATARDANNNVLTGRPTTWASSNSAVATVNAGGVVTGIAVGTARITATSEGIAGVATITVSVVPVARITVIPSAVSIVEGQVRSFIASLVDSTGNQLFGRAQVWTSSNVAVASVSPGGVVTAVAPGTSTITVTAPNAGVGGSSPSGTGSVIVTFAPVASVSIAPSVPAVTVGTSAALTPTLQSASPVVTLASAGRTLTWSVADASIASISTTGVVTGIGPGNTTVTLTASSPGQATPVSATVPLTVTSVPVARIALAPLAGTIHVGTLYARQLSAQVFDASNNVLVGRPISWSTSDPNLLTVTPAPSGSGAATLTALSAPTGRLQVIASAAGGAGPVADTITIDSDLVPIAAVTVSPSAAKLLPGQTQALVATASDSAGNVIGTAAGNPLGGRMATWSSADAAVGTVSTAGVVTAVAVGSTTIDAAFGGAKPGTFALSVVPVPVAAVSVSAPGSSLTVGNTMQATVVARDTAGTVLSLVGRTVVWSSASANIATVGSSGLVTAVGAGSTTISVTVDGMGPATLPLSVVPPVVVPAQVATVSVTAPDSSLTTGTTVQATAIARDAQGVILSLAGRTVAWTSNATGVATVSSSGVVSAIAPGNATIGVTVDGLGPATIPLTVIAPAVASVSVTPAAAPLIVGGTVAVVATPRDAAGNPLTNRPIAWSLSNAKASISTTSGGATTLTALDSGVVILTATSGGQTGTSTTSISLIPVDTVESVPASSSPSVSLRAGLWRNSLETFRALSATGATLSGRAFTVTISTKTLATALPFGTAITDSRGRGEFLVVLSGTARRGDQFTVTVTIDGKSTVWQVSVT